MDSLCLRSSSSEPPWCVVTLPALQAGQPRAVPSWLQVGVYPEAPHQTLQSAQMVAAPRTKKPQSATCPDTQTHACPSGTERVQGLRSGMATMLVPDITRGRERWWPQLGEGPSLGHREDGTSVWVLFACLLPTVLARGRRRGPSGKGSRGLWCAGR